MTLAISAYQRQLWRDMTTGEGVLRNASAALQAAYFATPRHRFVSTYRTWHNREWRSGDLAEIYSDDSLILVGDDNGAVISSASQPSYVLSLVQWLDVKPGNRVLDIGSGCGWLSAVMAWLVGPLGAVTGVEILPGLAAASRRNLEGVGNVEIITGDGMAGYAPRAPYDRIIATAGMPIIPGALAAQTAPGARLVLPIATGEATRCAVTLFERSAEGLEQIEARDGYFVPIASVSEAA
jgi:protein-L-isoaspartate(D-aspartate) O-methyltransferase